MFIRNEERPYRDLGGGVRRKILVSEGSLMNVELLFEAGAKGEMHSHPHEQIGYVIEGTLVFHEEGKEDVTLTAGDSYYAAPNVAHGIDCVTAVKLLDIFTPVREDFLRLEETD